MSVQMVYQLFICPLAGEPMEEQSEIVAHAGRGIVGDRYYNNARGTFSGGNPRRSKIRHISLIEKEAITAANASLRRGFSPGETRRNVVTRGVGLNNLVGLKVRIGGSGGVLLQGIELCDPCGWPSKRTGKSGFKDAYKNHGGLRAEILRGGTITAGDLVEILND